MLVKLFDGKTGFGNSNIYVQNQTTAVTDTYDTLTSGLVNGSAFNTICIETDNPLFTDEYVQNTPDSIPIQAGTKLIYSGDYRIAHIMSAVTYNLLACKGAVAGHIQLGSAGQTSQTCSAFSFENNGTDGNYCSDHTASKLIIQSSQPYELTNYTVTLEILVNGNPGEHGVYFSSDLPAFSHYATSALACSGQGTTVTPSATYLRGDGTTTATPLAAISGACSAVLATNKAVKLTTVAGSLGFISGDMFLFVDLPRFNYNLSEVNVGDAVSIRVTLGKSTCGVVFPAPLVIPIGVFGCGGSLSTLMFPYYTSLTHDIYWNGIAIENRNPPTTPVIMGNIAFTAHEKDGDVCTATATVAPGQMFVSLLENMTWTKASGVSCGGTQLWIKADCDFDMEGFAMMGQAINAGDSMGYLPRRPSSN
jgi:hypothetical protein